jgi:small subunit ribosomal protein S2
LKETVRGLLRAIKYFNRVAAGGGLILFVGTKRQAVDIVVEHAQKCGMPYVTERWLGGTLTNFQTIRSRLDRLDELEQTLGSDMALTYSKKALSTLNREQRKISRNLEGIRHMTRRPEAMFVIDPHREKIAVSEARKLGVKVVSLMDTDCDPDVVDLPIPGNDDSMRAIELILSRLTQAIIDGKAAAPPEPPRPEPGPGGPGTRGRLERRGGVPSGPGPRSAGASAPAPASDPATSAGAGQSPPVAPSEPGDSSPQPLPAAGPTPEGVSETAPIVQPSAGPEATGGTAAVEAAGPAESPAPQGDSPADDQEQPPSQG